jgi:hypothetical protein
MTIDNWDNEGGAPKDEEVTKRVISIRERLLKEEQAKRDEMKHKLMSKVHGVTGPQGIPGQPGPERRTGSYDTGFQGKLWPTPVDMLKEVIRDIESGERNPTSIFVGLYEENEEYSAFPYYCTGLNRLELIGYLMHQIQFFSAE